MTRKLKFFVVFAMLALLPLRALAAVTVGLCANYDSGTPAAQLGAHHHGATDDETSPQGDASGSPSVCNLCTACCTGASFAPDTRGAFLVAGVDLEHIPFFGRDPGAHVPDQLDRPPLSR